MKNKVYFQKQKLNWNKNMKDYLARRNFKQTRSYNKKEKPQPNNLDFLGLDNLKTNTLSRILDPQFPSSLRSVLKEVLKLYLLSTGIMLGMEDVELSKYMDLDNNTDDFAEDEQVIAQNIVKQLIEEEDNKKDKTVNKNKAIDMEM